MTSDDDLMDSNEVARMLGVSIHTVRDYKKRGLIKIAAKRANKDLYSRLDVTQRRSVIDEKRREGYSLAQIRSMVG